MSENDLDGSSDLAADSPKFVQLHGPRYKRLVLERSVQHATTVHDAMRPVTAVVGRCGFALTRAHA